MQRQAPYSDDLKTLPIRCEGGLMLHLDILTQSAQFAGSALTLQNFEDAIEGGYKRILGHSKYDSTTVPGDSNSPITGVKVGLGGVFAVRYKTADTSNHIYFSSGSGWTKINGATVRGGTVAKTRGVESSILMPAIIFTDGVNYACKWDGTTFTTLNSVGAPTDPKFAAVFANRLVLAGYSSDPQELTISEPNTDIAFTGGGGAATIPCSDTIVGIRTFRAELYVYCRNSIKKLTGNSASNFAIVDVTNSIGCLSNDTIQEVSGDVIFLAPDGFRSTAATSRIGDTELGLVSRQVQPLVRLQVSKSNSEDKYSSLVIRGKNQYRCHFNDGDTNESGQIGFIGTSQDRTDPLGSLIYNWSTTMGIKPYCCDSAYTNNEEIAVFGHPTDGYVRRFESGNSFDGTAISAIYRSPDLFFDSDRLRKVGHKVTTYTQLDGAASVNFRVYLDRNDPNVIQPSALLLSQTGGGAVYGTDLYDTGVYASFIYPVFETLIVGAGRAIAFEYSSTDTNPPYRIDDYTITYSLKGYR